MSFVNLILRLCSALACLSVCVHLHVFCVHACTHVPVYEAAIYLIASFLQPIAFSNRPCCKGSYALISYYLRGYFDTHDITLPPLAGSPGVCELWQD